MDGERFDTIARRVGATSRRGVVAALMAGVFGAVLGPSSGGAAAECRRTGERCLRNSQCCNGSCSRGVCGGTRVPVFGYRVVDASPHDRDAFTQGLVYVDGDLYEGTGRYGASTLRRVRPQTGEVVQSTALAPSLFGEGIAVVGDRIYQLTWQNQVGFAYNRWTFKRLQTFGYETEGWGLATDGGRLIMSDGSDTLSFRDPETFREVRRVVVRDGGRTVAGLNELEYVAGQVWANVIGTDRLARIDPSTGRVTGWANLTGLLSPEDRRGHPVGVLNGIAHDPATGHFFVTGKNWPKLFEIELVRSR